jgi:hypothetical protein
MRLWLAGSSQSSCHNQTARRGALAGPLSAARHIIVQGMDCSARAATRSRPGAFKSVLVRINIEGWRALKVLAAEQEATLNALAVEAFNDLLKKHGKRQSVENPLLD